MEGNNTAPFFIGQDVVCIKTCVSKRDSSFIIKEGDRFKVKGQQLCACGMWYIDVGLTHHYKGTRCTRCGSRENTSVLSVASQLLAPIEYRTVEICKEVLDSLPKITEERSDVVVKPATVTNLHQQLLDSIDDMIALLPSLPEEIQQEYSELISRMIDKTKQLITE